VDVDVGQDPRLIRDRAARDPRADHVPRGICEAEVMRAVAPDLPVEDLLVEGGRRVHVDSGDLHVGKATVPEQMPLGATVWRFVRVSLRQ
jgi:hypothetical protein